MSEPFSVSCPKCRAKLKLKSQAAVGKKIACPKCSTPFVVKPPKPAEEELSFLDVSEPDDVEDEGSEVEESQEEPESPRSRSAGRRSTATGARSGRGKKGKSRSVEWQKPALIAGLSLLLLGGLGGLGYVAMSWLQAGEPKNNFDTVFLPPDAEAIVQLRPSELLTAPLVTSTLQHPAIKPNLDFLLPMAEGMLGLRLADIETVTIGLPNTFEPSQQSLQALGAGQVESVIVIKTRQPVPAATRQPGSGFESASLSGKTVFRPKAGSGSYLVWMADDLRTVMAPESQLQRLLTQGKTLKRRPDLDFVANDKHLVLAYVPADRSKLDRLANNLNAPSNLAQGAGGLGGGMPFAPGAGGPGGGMPGPPGAGMPGVGGPGGSATNPLAGKLTGMALSVQMTGDILLETQNQCVDAVASKSLLETSQASIENARNTFRQQKTQLQLMASIASAGEFVPILDEIVNSVSVASEGSLLTQKIKIPGSLKPAVENFLNSDFFKTLVQNGGQGGGANAGGLPFDPAAIFGGMGGFLPGAGRVGGPASLGGTQQPAGSDDADGFGTGTPPAGIPGAAPGIPGGLPNGPGPAGSQGQTNGPAGGLQIGQPPGPAAGGANPQAPPGVAPEVGTHPDQTGPGILTWSLDAIETLHPFRWGRNSSGGAVRLSSP